MRPLLLTRFFLTTLTWLALTGPVHAQTPPSATGATDVILRLDGQEIPGRVLVITPVELRYLPAAATTPDTMRLPIAEVFLVRYANGTREVLTRPPGAAAGTTGPAGSALGDGRLAGLPGTERQRLGQNDAVVYYRGRQVFWGSAGATFYLGPLFGLGSTAVIAGQPVSLYNLRAPTPALLSDPDYNTGYRQQANRIKRGKAWAGYGTGIGAQAVVLIVVIAALFSGQP